MRRAIALALLIGTAWVVRAAGGGERAFSGAALALGFALVAALLVGERAEKLRLPRVTGYLIFGLLCGPYIANLISRPMARDLRLVNGLAVALIAFIAGLEINLKSLAPRLRGILLFSVTLIAAMYLILATALWVAWPWLPILPHLAGAERLAVVLLTTTMIVSFSPTVTMAVIAESRSSGRFCEMLVAVVVLADLVLILCFALAMQYVRWVGGGTEAENVSLLARLLWEIPGSLAFGALMGALFAFYVRHVGREVTLVLLALCVILSELGRQLHFEPLLAALAAGLIVENIAPPEGHALKDAIERGALPVFIIFFAAAGASLQLDALATIGLFALAVAALRFGAIRLGARTALGLSGLEPEHGKLLWMGLVSQAGVTLGLAIIVAAEFPAVGQPVNTLIVAMIALHELVGPVLLRAALARAGEVGAIGRENAA